MSRVNAPHRGIRGPLGSNILKLPSTLLCVKVKVNLDFSLLSLTLALIPAVQRAVNVENTAYLFPPLTSIEFLIRFRRNYGNTTSPDKFTMKVIAPLGRAQCSDTI